MDRCELLKLVYRLAQVAGVQDAHPHRFRHTFAIQYLRNGGNERTLQDVLGHESLDMQYHGSTTAFKRQTQEREETNYTGGKA